MLLRKLGLHAGNGSFEEERNQMFVCAVNADLLEGGDVGGAIFEADDEQWMIGSKEYEVSHHALECLTMTAMTMMTMMTMTIRVLFDDVRQ